MAAKKASEWAQLFMNSQQSVRAEQTNKALAELQRQQKAQTAALQQQLAQLQVRQESERKARRVAQALKQAVFNARQAVNGALAGADAYLAYFRLMGIAPLVEQIPVAALQELSDREYHAQTVRLLKGKMAAIVQEWGKETHSHVQALYRLLSEIKDIGSGLAHSLREAQASEDKRAERGVPMLLETLDALEAKIGEAAQLAEAIPDFRLTAYGYEKVFDSLLNDLVRPQRQALFALKCMILISKADGKLDSTERSFLVQMGRVIHLTDDDTQALIEETRQIKLAEFGGDVQAADRLVSNVYRCAKADGEVSDREKAMVEKIARSLGIEDARTKQLLAASGTEAGVTVLDVEALLETLRRADPKAMKKAHLRGALPEEVERWMRSAMGIPGAEDIIAARDWKTLGSRVASGALTTEKLYLYLGKAATVAVPLGGIVDFEPKIMSGHLQLAGGKQVKVPNCMNAWLSALMHAIAGARRTV